jgi:hypothetical protein
VINALRQITSPWLLFLGCLGIIFYNIYYPQVFPSASIDLKVPRQEIQKQSLAFANTLGYDTKGSIESTIFSYDDQAKTFLEYELGLNEANRLMSNNLPVWYWSTRICKVHEYAEFSANISPQGRLLSLSHTINNDLKLPSISREKAQALATSFIEKDAGVNLAKYKLIEVSTTKQPFRSDHYFTFEDQSQSYKGAHVRIGAGVSGNKLTSYGMYLHVPESWSRKFEELRSYNEALKDIASVFYLLLNIGTFFGIIIVFTKGQLRWKFTILGSIAMAVLSFLDSLNSMPSYIHSYNTEVTYQNYLLQVVFQALMSAFTQLVQSFALLGSAEAIYRRLFPEKLALEKFFSKSALKTQEASQGLLTGHLLSCLHLGWVVVFYYAGRKFGFWAPLEVQNVETLSSAIPAYSACFIGVSAAVSEELTYRVFGLGLANLLFKNYWLANIAQAVAWALMHSDYPQEPPYARGLELTVVGIVYGIIVRRFGLMPAIIGHYLLDAFLGVGPLISSTDPWLKITAYAVLIPFAIVLCLVLNKTAKQGFAPSTPYQNKELVTHMPVVSKVEPEGHLLKLDYKPLTKQLRLALITTIILSCLVQFCFYFPLVGHGTKLLISREQAIGLSKTYLQNKGINTTGYYSCAKVESGWDSLALQYIFEKTDFKRTDELSKISDRPLVYYVRFFKPLDPKEYHVIVNSKGRVLRYGIDLPEEAAALTIPVEEAKIKGETFLQQERPEMLPSKLEETNTFKLDKRTDYSFSFLVPKYDVGEAIYKATVSVVDGHPSGFHSNWTLPDKWIWENQNQTIKDQIARWAVQILRLIGALFSLWWIIGIIRARLIRWHQALIFAGIASISSVLMFLNDLPEFYQSYQTTAPLVSFYTTQAVTIAMTVLRTFAIAAATYAFAGASLRILVPNSKTIILSICGSPKASSAQETKMLWIDGILAGLAVGIGYNAFQVLWSYLHKLISPVVSLTPLSSICSLTNVFSPALDAGVDALTYGFLCVLGAAIIAGVCAKYLPTQRSFFLVALFLSLVAPSTTRYWQDYLLDVLSNLFNFFISWLFVRKLGKNNFLAYFIAGYSCLISGSLRTIFMLAGQLYFNDLVILSALMISPIVLYYIVQANMKRREST